MKKKKKKCVNTNQSHPFIRLLPLVDLTVTTLLLQKKKEKKSFFID